MAKSNGESQVLDLPVQFGGVNLGDATARVGIKLDRSACDITRADETFCGRRLTGAIILGRKGDQPGQGQLVDTHHRVDGVFDVKRIGANAKEITTGLTFSLKDIDVRELAKFSKGSGRLLVNSVAELPEDEAGDDESDGSTPDTLKAEGPWRDVPLDTMFHGALLKSLKKAGLATVGHLADYTASEKRLTDIDGVGEGKAQQIEDQMLQFWADNPGANETDQNEPETAAAATEDWRQAELSALGLTTGVIDMFREGNVSTIGGLIELKAAIDNSAAVWPKGIGATKAEDVCKRLEDFREKHEAAPTT